MVLLVRKGWRAPGRPRADGCRQQAEARGSADHRPSPNRRGTSHGRGLYPTRPERARLASPADLPSRLFSSAEAPQPSVDAAPRGWVSESPVARVNTSGVGAVLRCAVRRQRGLGRRIPRRDAKMKESTQQALGQMNRRTMLATTTALVGGALAGAGEDRFCGGGAQSASGPRVRTARTWILPWSRSKGGKLRGLREGKTPRSSASATRKPSGSGCPSRSRRGPASRTRRLWGPVCPARSRPRSAPTSSCSRIATGSRTSTASILNVWTQNLTPAAKKPVMVWMHGGGFTNGSSMESYAYDGRSAQRVRRRRGGQREPPAEHPRHARSVGLRSAVRELALHRHGRSGGGAAVGAATTSSASAAIPAT